MLFVFDAIETTLPPPGVYAMTDGEQQTVMHTRSRSFQKNYEARFQERRDYFEMLCRRHSMSLIPVSTQADLLQVLRNELVARIAA